MVIPKFRELAKWTGSATQLERLIRYLGRSYAASNPHFMLWKLPADLRIVGKGNLVAGEKMPCDFMGYNGSRVVMLEAKTTAGPYLDIGAHIKPHQLGALSHCAESGGLASIIWARKGSQQIVALNPCQIIGRVKWGQHDVRWANLITDLLDNPQWLFA